MNDTETMAEPDWLAAKATDPAKLRAIMGAVHRCHMECPSAATEDRTGPHITTSMAEVFIAQMMEAETASTARERDVIMRDLGDHARPETPHQVMQMCVREAFRLRKLENDLRLMLEVTP